MFCDMLRTPLTRMKFQTCIRLTYNINQIYTLSWSMYIEIMTSLRYGRIFCLEIQKIDGTEYLMGSTELAIF